VQSRNCNLEQLLDRVELNESDRRAAKAAARQAEILVDLVLSAAAAIRSAMALPRRLKLLSPRAR